MTQAEPKPLRDHVQEVRRHAIIYTTAWLLGAALTFCASGFILSFVQADVGVQLHTFTPYEILSTQIFISLTISFLLSLPLLFSQSVLYLKDVLSQQRITQLSLYLASASLVGIGGALFGYFVIVDSVLAFFTTLTESSSIATTWGLDNLIRFIFRIVMVTSLLFQLPIIITGLGHAGFVTPSILRRYRRHVYVFALLLAALLSPPDIVSQLLIALPTLFLYEVSILIVTWIHKN